MLRRSRAPDTSVTEARPEPCPSCSRIVVAATVVEARPDPCPVAVVVSLASWSSWCDQRRSKLWQCSPLSERKGQVKITTATGSTCNPFQLHIVPGSPDQDSSPSFSSRLGLKLKLRKKGCQIDLIAHPTHTCVGLSAKALAFGGTTLPPAPGCLRIVIVAKGRAEPCPPVVVVTVGARPEPSPLHSSSSCWGAQPEPCPSRPRHRGESTAGAVPLVIVPSLSSRCPRGHHREKWRHAGAQVHRRHGGTAGAAPRPPQSSS